MKTIKLVIFLGVLALTLPLSMWASSACGAPTVVSVDGEPTNFDFVASGPSPVTNYYEVNFAAGHSYSCTVRQNYDDVNTDISVTLWSDAGACSAPVTIPSSTPPLTATTANVDPQLPANAFRFSIIPTLGGNYEIGVRNSNTAVGRYIEVACSETTLYSPNFFHGGNYITAYTFGNSTGSTITGTLTLLDANTGLSDGMSSISMPGKGAALITTDGVSHTNATQLIVSGTKGGSAILAHLGPPNSVQGASFVQNFSSNPPFSQPFEMKAIKQGP